MCELYLNTMAIKIPLKYIYLHFSLFHTMKFKRYLILVLKWKWEHISFPSLPPVNENRWKKGKALLLFNFFFIYFY